MKDGPLVRARFHAGGDAIEDGRRKARVHDARVKLVERAAKEARTIGYPGSRFELDLAAVHLVAELAHVAPSAIKSMIEADGESIAEGKDTAVAAHLPSDKVHPTSARRTDAELCAGHVFESARVACLKCTPPEPEHRGEPKRQLEAWHPPVTDGLLS